MINEELTLQDFIDGAVSDWKKPIMTPKSKVALCNKVIFQTQSNKI